MRTIPDKSKNSFGQNYEGNCITIIKMPQRKKMLLFIVYLSASDGRSFGPSRNLYNTREKETPCTQHVQELWHTLSHRTGSALAYVPKVARLRLTERSKSCDLQPALHCAIHGAQWVLP